MIQTQPISPNPQALSPLNSLRILKRAHLGRNPVYFAYDTKSDRQVTLKTFRANPALNQNYLQEKAHLLTLNHPHIVRLLESCDTTTFTHNNIEEDISYLTFEYAPYGDLLEIISKYGKLPEILARTLFHQLLDALSYLHGRNIAHMDLKAENLLIDDDLNLKLIDFDLSQPLDSGVIKSNGTPGYRAPEFKTGSCHDFRALDIYSAAVVLFILVTGYPPYTESSRGGHSTYDAYYRVMRTSPDRFWEIHAKHSGSADFYSEDFKKMVTGMLAEASTDRPTLEDLVNSSWYQGPVLSTEEYQMELKKYLKRN